LVEYSIDGGDFKKVDLYHRYSKGQHYPPTSIGTENVPDGWTEQIADYC